MARRVWTVAPLLLSLSVIALPDAARAALPELGYTIVKSWSTLYSSSANPAYGPVNSPDGIAWDGSGLWVTECGGTVFAKFDLDGALVDEFTLPGGEMADHLAFDGTHLWANVHSHPDDPGAKDPTAQPDGRLIQIDLQTKRIVNTITIPWAAWTMAPMGLGFDGQNLWTNAHMAKKIYRIDPDTLEGLETPAFANPVDPDSGMQINSCGTIWDGQACLWVSDLTAGKYYQVDPETGEIASVLIPPENPDPTKYGAFRPDYVKKLFTGMTTDGSDRVWIMDEVEGNPLVYELRVDFPTTGPCAHAVALGEACTPGGQPFCGEGAVCAGEAGAETCALPPVNGGGSGGGAPDDKKGKGGCASAPGAGTTGGALALLLFAALWTRRRARL